MWAAYALAVVLAAAASSTVGLLVPGTSRQGSLSFVVGSSGRRRRRTTATVDRPATFILRSSSSPPTPNDDDDDWLYDLDSSSSTAGRTNVGDAGGGDDDKPRRRRRDALKDWLTKGGATGKNRKGLIEPIALEGGGKVATGGDGQDVNADGSDSGSGQGNRVRLETESLFEGAPSLDAILSDSREEGGEIVYGRSADSRTPPGQSEAEDVLLGRAQSPRIEPPPLGEEDATSIERKFDSLRKTTKEKLSSALRAPASGEGQAGVVDAATVSEEEAASILEQALREQMDAESYELREERSYEDFSSYYAARQRNQLAADRLGSEPFGVVKEIVEEAADITARREDLEKARKEFEEYEQSVQDKADEAVAERVWMEREGQDVAADAEDEVTLAERAIKEVQASRRKIGQFGVYANTVNLEEGLEEVRRKREEKGDKIKPDNLKEWQMYRAIVSKVQSEKDGKEGAESSAVDEADAARLLEQWKELQEREDTNRRELGLTYERRMPFEWMDDELREKEVAKLDAELAGAAAALAKDANAGNKNDARDPAEIRADFDRMALGLMEDLLAKRKGRVRGEGLEKNLEKLRSSIQAAEEARKRGEDIEGSAIQRADAEQNEGENSPSIVDVSEIFGDSLSTKALSSTDAPAEVLPSKEAEDESATVAAPPPPETPFFSSFDEDDMGKDDAGESFRFPPDTPFFSSFDEDDMATDENFGRYSDASVEGNEEVQFSMGTFQEQKFRSLKARAGVRTQSEAEELQSDWEQFQEAERKMREGSGLSGDLSDKTIDANLEYDIQDVLKEGGEDIDAETVLASIGPRPTKKKVSAESVDAVEKVGGSSTDEDTLVYSQESPTSTDKRKDQSYRQFLEYEQRAREQKVHLAKRRQEDMSVESGTTGGDSDETSPSSFIVSDDSEGDGDDNKDVIIFHGHATKMDESSDVKDQIYRSVAAVGGGKLRDEPEAKAKDKAAFEEYVQKEEEMRENIEGVTKAEAVKSVKLVTERDNEDDFDDEEYADDFFSQLGPRPKPRPPKKVEIDSPRIDTSGGAILKSGVDRDGDEDENLPPRGSMAKRALRSSFSKKEETPGWLLREQEEQRGEHLYDTPSGDDYDYEDEYLDDEEYRERERQAEEFERRHSKASKEVSLSDIFGRDYFGPDDYGDFEGRGIPFSSFEARKENLLEYTELTVEELNSLMEQKLATSSSGFSRYIARVNKPYHEFGAIFRLEGMLVDMTGMAWEAWKKTAIEYGYNIPSLEDAKLASLHRAETAVQRVFYWTSNYFDCLNIAETYRNSFHELFTLWMEEEKNTTSNLPLTDVSSSADERDDATKPTDGFEDGGTSYSDLFPSKDVILGMQSEAWKRAAFTHGFAEPSLENVLVASLLNPDDAVISAFRWTNATSTVGAVTATYRKALRSFSEKWLKDHNLDAYKKWQERAEVKARDASSKPISTETTTTDKGAFRAPSGADVAAIQYITWKQTAEKYDFEPPSLEQAQIATFVDPEKAVKDIFGWTLATETPEEIASTFRGILRIESKSMVDKFRVIQSTGQTNSSADASTPISVPFTLTLQEGVLRWLKTLEEVKMPCAVVSHMEQEQLDTVLEQTGLSNFFPPDQRVSASSGYREASQELLGAALRIERRPDHCVVFETTPISTTAAHEVEMKLVALMAFYPKYELITADMTARYLDELSMINIRNLFSERDDIEPMAEVQQAQTKPDERTQTKVRFWEEGDRN